VRADEANSVTTGPVADAHGAEFGSEACDAGRVSVEFFGTRDAADGTHQDVTSVATWTSSASMLRSEISVVHDAYARHRPVDCLVVHGDGHQSWGPTDVSAIAATLVAIAVAAQVTLKSIGSSGYREPGRLLFRGMVRPSRNQTGSSGSRLGTTEVLCGYDAVAALRR
jgi:hypothetical protein